MNKSALSLITFLGACGLVLAACASAGTQAGLAGTSWKLVSYGPAGTPAAPGIDTNLDFATDGTVNGNMGCNSFGGNFEVKNDTIVFSQVISTMMACQGPQMMQEGTAFKVMNGTVHFQISGKMMTIRAASGDSVIVLSK